jgi:uncharacterized protein
MALKYLIDIGHPAHVHYFKNFADDAMKKGHQVLFTCRDKDVTIMLLEQLKFKFVNLGPPYKSLLGKTFGLLYFTLRILWISVSFKPNMFLNATMYSAFVAWLLRKPHLAFEDTFNMEQVRLYLPFTSCILTGSYHHPALGRKEIRFCGYQALLYLHAKHFAPDIGIYNDLCLSLYEPYVIVRFVSWNASHDLGHTGISERNKYTAIEKFSEYAKVFISSESPLPDDLERHRITIPPHRMHDALAFSCLVFGESSTMSEEAAILGVPSVYVFNNSTYYTTHLEEDYGLMFNYSESDKGQLDAIERGCELLKKQNLKEEWQKRRTAMLSGKIDVTAFLIWFVENWPESFSIMKTNPDFQKRFE